jgi:sugar/nucleoside kinase (ribokinase family)
MTIGYNVKALFIGQSYIDLTFLVDAIPVGDEKTVAQRYAVSFGGNAVTAAFCCAKLGIAPDLIASVADDWLGRMFIDMAAKYGISLHHRKVVESSLSFIMPKGDQRAIVRCRDDHFNHPFPVLNLAGCRVLHVDGHLADAAIHYAKVCQEAGMLTSLDGGGLRSNTHELLAFIETAVVAERLCEQMHLTPGEMLTYLRSRGCKIGAVTMGAKGMIWYDETGTERFMPALTVPKDRVVDTNGAGDIFHGAYIYSYLRDRDTPWERHFKFARAASAHSIQYLGNEASLPTLAQVNEAQARFAENVVDARSVERLRNLKLGEDIPVKDATEKTARRLA